MDLSTIAPIVLAAVAAGGVAYVFLYPLLSGGRRAEQRQKLLTQPAGGRDRSVAVAASRRDQVAQTLKDLDQKQKAASKLTIEKRIQQAGLTWSRGKFMLISVTAGLVAGLALLIVTGSLAGAVAGLFVGGLGAPRWVLNFLKKRRINAFLNELPNAMDVIVRGIRAGLPFGDCVRIVANEAQEPVRSEFRYLVEQQSLGISVSDAILRLYERVPVPESNFLAIVISIQAKAGGNLSETINNLSRVLRDRKKMKGKIQAMSMEAKASAGIIASLPFIVGILTYISSRTYVELLWTTNAGKMMLVVSAIWMGCGIMVMKKMINFDF